ncbi:unnamed protein product [Caenorhabditis angaria]|uniref:Uncharacterized protein n=1 Tax=Caenorhabditis angaria TaxID=860376 RepID=A0A9P1MSY7_9PELO|nr:unnamed protein product [Caenorhabditis angaria]
MLKLLLVLSIFISFFECQADELISARCQSQCLHLMELKLQENPEHRKGLKHYIIQLCKDDATCSACSQPCREPFENVKDCKKQCVSTSEENRKVCEESCDYLQQIYNEKPGNCPAIKNASRLYECSALCRLDGDCPETQKCCSYGCSRQCSRPDSKSNERLLPVPRNITIQERKRKRSIIIRWSTGKWSKKQQNENSNVFLVQWRWGLHIDTKEMTEWQTVTIRNKPYAILKHLLSPGRFYQFRIAAVSFEGSVGFSQPSEPFKISKEATAPPPPREMSLGNSKLTPIGLWNQIVRWIPPQSDLPIKNYQVSWSASTQAEAEQFEQMMKKKATMEHAEHEKRSIDENEDEFGIDDSRDRHSVIIPSHSTNAEISGLFPNSVYIVEIHATVDSSDGELHGEKGVIFIRTNDAKVEEEKEEEEKKQIIETKNDKSEELKVEEIKSLPVVISNRLEVTNPYFFAGELQTLLSWNCVSPNQKANSYTVRVRKTLCREYQPNHHSDTRWHDLRVSECSTILKGLSFDCDYKVEVSTNSGELIVDGVFSTESCELTEARENIDCATFQTPIQCQVSSESSAHCHWTRHNHQDQMQTVIGYRILLSSPSSHDTNTTINQPQLREVRYEQLKPAHLYTVEVQSITNRGLGRSVSTQFVTLPQIDQSIIERFPGGEIIELPLESSFSTSTSKNILIFPIFFIFFRIFQ